MLTLWVGLGGICLGQRVKETLMVCRDDHIQDLICDSNTCEGDER